MGISVADNFDHKSKKPLDARTSYSTLALMKAVIDANINEGCLAYCAETDKYYKFLSTNTVDESTGKWREFSSGGGGGSTYTAGDGIDITNDVISTKQSEVGDIDEIIGLLPSGGTGVTLVNAFNKSDLYSTDEKMIGQWTDGKPLYSKTFNSTTGNTTSQTLISNLGSLNIDTMVSMTGKLVNSGLTVSIPAYLTATGYVGMYHNPSANSIVAFVGSDWYNQPVTITLQYTKTTDSAVSIGTANEYSTDEKIVGTWIDSKPIYQKTLTVAMSGGTTEGMLYWKQVDVSSLNIDCYVSLQAVLKGTNICKTIPNFEYVNSLARAYSIFGWANTQINIHINENNSTLLNDIKNSNAYITIQYTKTT